MEQDQQWRGGEWVAAQMALLVMIFVAGWVWRAPTAAWLSWAGSALLILGAVLGLGGAMALGGNLTPFPRPRPGGDLVQHGVYRLIRHPLYTAVLALALGWSLCRGSLPAILASTALAVLLDAKARREERWLHLRFPAYHHYSRRTWRFIPWVY